MDHLRVLMQAEREFTKLTELKKKRSKDTSLSLFHRNLNLYHHLKCKRERDSYRREIEEIADELFPLHLELDILSIIQPSES